MYPTHHPRHMHVHPVGRMHAHVLLARGIICTLRSISLAHTHIYIYIYIYVYLYIYKYMYKWTRSTIYIIPCTKKTLNIKTRTVVVSSCPKIMRRNALDSFVLSQMCLMSIFFDYQLNVPKLFESSFRL